jgi:hypothetical protein
MGRMVITVRDELEELVAEIASAEGRGLQAQVVRILEEHIALWQLRTRAVIRRLNDQPAEPVA